MLRNYFLTTWRTLVRQRSYALLNIVGLSVGMAVSLLIILFVFHEFSYDRFHAHAERIFKASNEMRFGERDFNSDRFSVMTAPVLKQNNAEIENFVRMAPYDRVLLWPTGSPDRRLYEDRFLFADSSFLSVFNFPLLKGNAKTALNRPFTILITPEMAAKYFGNENPVGRKLSYQTTSDFFALDANRQPSVEHLFEVTGIIEKAPSNSSIDYQFVASFSTLAMLDKNAFAWQDVGVGNYQTYFLLTDASKVGKIRGSLKQLVKAPMPEAKLTVLLEALPDLHLYGKTSSENLKYVYVFLGVALVILSLALVNYMSLTTARATQRAKEVGVRKVIGASRRQLAVQFFGESVLLCSVAFVLAWVWMQLALPVFQQLLQVKLPVRLLWQPAFLGIAAIVFLASSLLAGSYPALLLSGFAPVSVLKGGFKTDWGSARVRRVFIVFQFAVSGVLICCSLIMQRQMDFMRSKDIGLNKDRMLVIPVEGSVGRKYLNLKEEIRRTAGVTGVGASTSVPFDSKGINLMTTQLADKRLISLTYNSVDSDFLKTYGIRWHRKTPAAESFAGLAKKVLINETAAKELGYREPLGSYIPLGDKPEDKVEIVGILKDFNIESLQARINPMMIWPVQDTAGNLMQTGGYLSVRLDKKAELPGKIAQFRKMYSRYEPEKPFEYFFLDEKFNRLYQYQDRLANVLKAFTGFAILIACLGLFGLATFTAERRTKEIGIRKILGASVSQVVTLLSKDFLVLVTVAFVIATPIAWYAMNRWLQDFAYRIDISWWIFAVAGVLALLIALVTVSFQAVKAALANPVKSLRSE